MFKKSLLFISAVLMMAACKSGNKETTGTDTSKATTDTIAKAPAAPVTVTLLWETDTVLKTPESVLFDKTRNVIFVSNINGVPTDKDKNGFISKLTPDGKVETLEWVKGFDAPKGLGVFGNKLYVTDITKLVEVDIEKGKITKTYVVPGAKFLNDVSIDSAGVVYFSDSETNKIHTLTNGKVATWLDKDLNKPNGLLVEKNRILLASYGSMDFKSIDPSTKAITPIASEIGAGDGIAYFGKEGHYIVSEWNGTVYLVEPDGSKNLLIDTKADKTNSADIDFIPESSTLLVPTFFKNKVAAYKVVHNLAK
jgi:sugar lactone lactonase YvrE